MRPLVKRLWFIIWKKWTTDELADISSESDLIPTSEAIKNIEVVFDEVNAETGEIEEEDFIINEVTSMPSEDSFEAIQEEDQTMLTFRPSNFEQTIPVRF